MIQENFEQKQQLDQIFDHSQFQQIIKAIILGKYSWACILFLHFSGYDPQDYIPQETYHKLLQENFIFTEVNHHPTHHRKLKFPHIKLSWIKLNTSKHSSN
ncbi:HetP family heterocyst commitment protein [Anabaena cylindrica FACHB-243]|uniref:Heterocyst differentiation protein n=1 Tax=Anabaena cylindrica (strain ATCC 27899 / PCC 7122) TaxID=272123 RepID=K9ZB05_ANACC|nr:MULTISPECIES: HetP family heterocyst commitment protein [Anabaena]AFZ55762.1 heterocyst differentiation protein [Anabaena cylindrica PCC 7122]MBD2420237.1 HetP family heterocyst commitment protein [Anabaena cylindrica FACHB-243]MBY5283108.1 HetP family heterocyst commitment protein [Anabaena sp. CCAP 1446/1C]MBY5311674.1 HetP family heterocyst commitment protein [Anabaena sp. CCAP 1446/1C]MCM2406111.1 HetP family heterocyst commitment protein [Anabaena sp. CCAP 1446/1C]